MTPVTCTIRDLMERVAECGEEYRATIMQAFVKRRGDSYTFDRDHHGWAEARRIRKRITDAGCLPCQQGKSRIKTVTKADAAAWDSAMREATTGE